MQKIFFACACFLTGSLFTNIDVARAGHPVSVRSVSVGQGTAQRADEHGTHRHRAKRNMDEPLPPVPQKMRICRRGNGLHYNPFGELVSGPWRICRVVPAHCSVSRGWFVDPEGREVYGTMRSCRAAEQPPKS